MKKYQIKTVQDMINCINEANLDNFLEDLKTLIQTAHMFNNMAELVGEHKSETILDKQGFTWIDDNKNDVKITLNTK